MPELQLNKFLGALRFNAKGIEMPAGFAEYAREWQDHVPWIKAADRVAVPRLIPAWFRPAMPIASHQLMCDGIGWYWKEFHDIMCDAVVYAHTLWRLQAKFSPMPIAGPTVVGPPGCLTGPQLEGFIKQYPRCVAMWPEEWPYRNAVARGVSRAFGNWQASVTIPGLPFYPSFSMQPPGSAAPTPNVPHKLVACIAADMTEIVTPEPMTQYMIEALREEDGYESDETSDALFGAIATVVALGMIEWLANQMVVSVIGSGAVTSPTGGAVAGVTLPTDGHLVS